VSKQDVTDALATILAAGAIVLQVILAVLALIAVAAIFSSGARRVLREIRETLMGTELWIAFAIALIATAGSLWFSEGGGYVPCRLCWIQRIAMYPLVPVLLVAALRRDHRAGVQYAFVMPIAGILTAGYHLYIEANPEAESASCKIGAPCSVKWIEEFGYITIPMLAMTAFVAIAALLAFSWSRGRRTGPAPPA
jgi:disulfide bond formation protein DsbB